LVFRQTAGFYQSKSDWANHNAADSSSSQYSILDELEQYRITSTHFIFKIQWDNDASRRIIWSQNSNPLVTVDTVENFQSLQDNTDGSPSFGGLAKSTARYALLDGNPTYVPWFYAIGSTVEWEGGVPAYDRLAKSVVELSVCQVGLI